MNAEKVAWRLCVVKACAALFALSILLTFCLAVGFDHVSLIPSVADEAWHTRIVAHVIGLCALVVVSGLLSIVAGATAGILGFFLFSPMFLAISLYMLRVVKKTDWKSSER